MDEQRIETSHSGPLGAVPLLHPAAARHGFGVRLLLVHPVSEQKWPAGFHGYGWLLFYSKLLFYCSVK